MSFHKKLGSFLLGLAVAAGSVVFGQVPISGLPQATLPLSGNEAVVLTQKTNCPLVNGCTRQATVSAISPITIIPVSALQGGTGEAGTVTGVPMANGTSPFTVATGAQIANPFTGCSAGVPYLGWLGTCITAGSVTSISQGTGITATPNPIVTSGSIAVNQATNFAWTGNQTLTPASGVGLIANGVAASPAIRIIGNATSGSSDGLQIQGGTTSADYSLLLQNQTGATNFLRVFGDGGTTLGTPTGGDQGLGTLNMTGCFINGVACGTGSGSVSSITAGTGITLTPSPITTTGSVAVNQAFTPTWSAQHIFSQVYSAAGSSGNSAIQLKSSAPAVAWVNTGGAVDAKSWDMFATATDLLIRATNDAGTIQKNILDVTRSGAVLTAIAVGNSTDKAPITLNGPVTIPVPSSGHAFVANGVAGANIFSGFFLGSAVAGQSNGVAIQAGAGSSADRLLDVLDHTGATRFFGVFGDGDFILGKMSGAAAGGISIAAPSSGSTLALSSVNGTTIPFVITTGTGATDPGIQVTDGTVNSQWQLGGSVMQLGTVSTHNLSFFTNNATRMVIGGSSGGVSIVAPSSGTALVATGLANNFTSILQGSATSGQSFGLQIKAGTTSADAALDMTNQSGSTDFFTVHGDGGVTVASPTGGDQGLGTINMTGCFVNGVACGSAAAVTGTVTIPFATASGCSAGTNATGKLRAISNNVTLAFSLGGSCNVTAASSLSFVAGTFPAGFRPAGASNCLLQGVTTAGAAVIYIFSISSSGAATMTLVTGTGTQFGITTSASCSYSLDT